MLKIEVIKFETQDVITTSVACICVSCDIDNATGKHISYPQGHPNGIPCPAQNHTCNNKP